MSVLLSSRPWSWSRVVSMPNLLVLVLVLVLTLTVLVLVLLLKKTKTLLISTVRSQPQSCEYYTSLRPTVPVSTCMDASLDFMQSWNCICLYQWHLRRLKGCSATVAYLWGYIVPDWENLCYPTLCSWSATGTWTTRMWLHGHWTLYQLSCRCSEWLDFIDNVLVLH